MDFFDFISTKEGEGADQPSTQEGRATGGPAQPRLEDWLADRSGSGAVHNGAPAAIPDPAVPVAQGSPAAPAAHSTPAATAGWPAGEDPAWPTDDDMPWPSDNDQPWPGDAVPSWAMAEELPFPGDLPPAAEPFSPPTAGQPFSAGVPAFQPRIREDVSLPTRPPVDQVKQTLLKGLNPEQKKVVQHGDGPLLVLAGAGSGKTMAITRRIAWLVEVEGKSPYSILAITFTNKAANEMKERIGALIGTVAERMWIGTFHSMFARILRNHGELLGYERSFTIVDSDDQLSLVRRIMKDQNISEERYKPRTILSYISGAKNQLKTLDEFIKDNEHNPNGKVAAKVWEEYQKQLRTNNAMDFDDILVNTVELLTRHTEVRELYQRRFRYILVDEYQDTNGAQYEAVRLLASAHQNICVVGDDDQSIYAFRGADITNILNFEKDYRGCTTVRLEQNYRSTGMILDAANDVISNNTGRKAKKLWTDSEKGEAITFYTGEDQYDEARFVAEEIERRIRQRSSGLTHGSFAVLYRANALSRSLEGAFRERGIPYRVYGGLRFYDRREIKDVIAYLRLIMYPGDNLSFDRVINVPKRGIGAATVETVHAIAIREGISNIEVCARSAEFSELQRSARRLHGFASLIASFRAALDDPDQDFAGLIELVENESGLIQSIIEEQEKGKDVTVDRIENLKELLSDANEFEENFVKEAAFDDPDFWDTDGSAQAAAAIVSEDEAPTLTELLNAFLEQASLYSQMDLDNEPGGFVRLMTIHSAKGLEFPVVFMVAAEEGIFPSRMALDSPAGEEEERRLAYVAITRAKQKLYITTARNRMLYGQTQCLPVSRFVREIPESCVEEIGGSIHGDARAFGATAGGTGQSSWGSRSGHGQGRTDGRLSPGFYGSGGHRSGGGYGTGGGYGSRGGSGSFDRSGARPGTAASSAGSGSGGARKPILGRSAATKDDKLSRGVDFIKSGSSSAKQKTAGAGAADAGLMSADRVQKGVRVVHPRLGAGVIQQVEPVAGDLLIKIRFDRGTVKPMLFKQAKLKEEK